ncbi:flagellar biosynthesis protein FlhB [Hydrogenivirga sp. 128-5-R1-1]|uniref:flagellar biosynthesis protein FlhB n=1 Tax=Hydrogenivirga sp. 128-5-R1-1 TaxID=392423 RepID=UPI00015F363F|nr:flagellar biosynthesis protein FlhB [Hydrogenivirga sp. 128-5-R1-1]EDP76574.1 flagellar biosynthetic protein FlhB [Hydrogenivirga sp. 128-5-R1-1]
MAQENKTEKATPYRRRKLKQEGNVAKSVEIASSLSVLISSLIIFFTGALIFKEVVAFLIAISGLRPAEFSILAGTTIKDSFTSIVKLLVPFFVVTILVVIGAHVAQFGFIFTLKPLQFKWERLNPVEGIKKMVSITTLFELSKNTLKASLLFGIALFILKGSVSLILNSAQMPLLEGVNFLIDLLIKVVLILGVIAFLIALLDFAYKKWDYERRIRMSKQEVKEEFKQLEGQPEVKAKVKARMREMARGRMMAEVPKASVVITNPTHYAIALRYDAEKDRAPVVVAKGKGTLAERIIKVAEENEVPVIRKPELARAMYSAVDVGDEIPPEFYRAVAEIIAFITFRKKRTYV